MVDTIPFTEVQYLTVYEAFQMCSQRDTAGWANCRNHSGKTCRNTKAWQSTNEKLSLVYMLSYKQF